MDKRKSTPGTNSEYQSGVRGCSYHLASAVAIPLVANILLHVDIVNKLSSGPSLSPASFLPYNTDCSVHMQGQDWTSSLWNKPLLGNTTLLGTKLLSTQSGARLNQLCLLQFLFTWKSFFFINKKHREESYSCKGFPHVCHWAKG